MGYSEKFAVIVAGGKGVRMGSALPKQFLPLHNKPVLYHTIQAFVSTLPDIHIILVLPHNQLSYAQMVLLAFPERLDMTILVGGETRFHSVQNGLKAVCDNSIIFVHDGVRPLVSSDLIHRCHTQALEKGSAIPAIKVPDSLRVMEDDGSRPVDREYMRIIQTPQTFRSDILLPAFRQYYQPSFTDEATVVESNGGEVFLIEGERSNIKMTTTEDMLVAETMLKARYPDAD
ncbi:MAG: 2-C-methyl-D-erythritol 4-phosphate cytidylyltransferase [Taibaiella sp.]|nr:2-C-methyl-D-erythritol 4-phosphate cytidylyltransferase [Taibaiella sp.]